MSWPIITLGEVTEIFTGQKDVNAGNPNGRYPFFTCAHKTYSIDSFTFDDEAVLVAGNGDFNVKYYEGKFDVYQRTYVLTKKSPRVSMKFIFELLKSDLPRLTANNQGSTIKYLKMGDFVNHPIPLPEIKVQERIANILEVVDEAIAATQKVIDQTERLKKALMQELFTRGNGHTKYKQTELGEIPESWGLVGLEDIATIERGKFSHRPRNAPELYGGDIPFIQTGDVVNSVGKVTKYSQTLNERGLAVSRIFSAGTIVMTIAANIGATAILDFDSCFPDSLVGITPTNDIDSVFLEFFLRTRVNYLDSISTQSAQKNINLEKLRPMKIAVPSLDEQTRIAQVLMSVDEKIELNKKLKIKQTELKSGLMQDLLTGKVRV